MTSNEAKTGRTETHTASALEMDNPGVARITVPRRARNRLGLKLAVPCWPPPRARERGLSGIGIGEDPTSPVHRAASAPPPCLPPASAGVSCISSATLAELVSPPLPHPATS